MTRQTATSTEPPPRIVLIGMAGAGKSTVARLLARRLGWRWADTDDLVVALDGREIAAIFSEEGEPFFRDLERRAVERLSRSPGMVIATGGGAPLDVRNRRHLWQEAFVVHLDTRPRTLLARMQAGARGVASRPLVNAEDPYARLINLKSARAPIYALADWVITTDGLSMADVAEEIHGAWQRRAAKLVGRAGRMDEIEQDGP